VIFPVPPRDAARFYRDRGWNPLPSRADAKRPDLPSYAAYWTSPIGPEVLDRWSAPNIQLMCGVHWGLAVVDLDGPEAADAWQAMTLYRSCPLTWTVRTGGGGLHFWVPTAPVVPCVPTGGRTFDRKAVLRAIPDKLSLVRSWGLRVRGWVPNVSGWLPCHALGRVDYKVSAGFNLVSGYYAEPPQFRLSLFEIGVQLGVFPDWQAAVNGLGTQFGGRS
jgi:hypothetical protein